MVDSWRPDEGSCFVYGGVQKELWKPKYGVRSNGRRCISSNLRQWHRKQSIKVE